MNYVLIPCPQCGKELKLRDRSLLGKKGKCPQCQHRFILEEPDEVQLELAEDAPAVGTSAQWVPDAAAAPRAAVATAPASSAPLLKVEEPAAVGSSRLKAAKQRRKQQMKIGLIVGSIASAIVIGVLILASRKPADTTSNTGENNPEKSGPAETSNPVANLPNPANVKPPAKAAAAPPKGEPIKLTHIPFGARIIIHVRPAELWKQNSFGETVRFSLGPLGVWAETKLKQTLLFEPKDIEEAVICLYLDDQTRPPDFAYKVTLVEQQKPSTFIEKFAGKPDTERGVKMYIRDATGDQPARAFMVTDQKGKEFASAPLSMAQEMVDAGRTPGLPAGGLEELLKRSDRNRHLTVFFQPLDILKMRPLLFSSSMHGLTGQFLDRFEDTKIESAAWSFYFGSNVYPEMFSELHLRNTGSISPRELQLDMQRKLESLPVDLQATLQYTKPRHMADRKLVGRLPVMVKAFQIETVPTIGTENERYVKLTTVLPNIAAPNIGAASVFAWNLVASTDFSKPLPKSGGGPKLAPTVDGRLAKQIEVDFRRLPLQNAFDYIGTETAVKTDIDGDALKDAGFTKNMPQIMRLGTVPAKQALAKIIKQYEGMVVAVDEPKKTIILTTRKFAEQKKQKILPLDK